jgi:hypothetical protein
VLLEDGEEGEEDRRLLLRLAWGKEGGEEGVEEEDE